MGGEDSRTDTELFDNLRGSKDFIPDTAALTENELESLFNVRTSGDCIVDLDGDE